MPTYMSAEIERRFPGHLVEEPISPRLQRLLRSAPERIPRRDPRVRRRGGRHFPPVFKGV